MMQIWRAPLTTCPYRTLPPPAPAIISHHGGVGGDGGGGDGGGCLQGEAASVTLQL